MISFSNIYKYRALRTSHPKLCDIPLYIKPEVIELTLGSSAATSWPYFGITPARLSCSFAPVGSEARSHRQRRQHRRLPLHNGLPYFSTSSTPPAATFPLHQSANGNTPRFAESISNLLKFRVYGIFFPISPNLPG